MSNITSTRNRALVIEDEPIVGRLCRKILVAAGFDVEIATNGLLAKDMVSKNVYDLYVSDIRTPEMDGIEFYHYLKNEYPDAVSRMIFTTGDFMNNEITAFLTEFKGPFLPKPFTADELIAAVDKVTASCTP